MYLLNQPLGKLALSLILLGAIAPVVVWFFRDTWIELDAEALLLRKARGEKKAFDARVMVTFLLGALSLLLINFYGSQRLLQR